LVEKCTLSSGGTLYKHVAKFCKKIDEKTINCCDGEHSYDRLTYSDNDIDLISCEKVMG